jgi:hypothetical protein
MAYTGSVKLFRAGHVAARCIEALMEMVRSLGGLVRLRLRLEEGWSENRGDETGCRVYETALVRE